MTQPHQIDREAVAARLDSLWLDLSDDRDLPVDRARIMNALHEASQALRLTPMEAVAWRRWLPHGAPPMDGQWFAARAPVGGGWQVRVVHYADRYDRLPIDHSGTMWSTEPTEWLPLSDFALIAPVQGGEG